MNCYQSFANFCSYLFWYLSGVFYVFRF
uniref:Uncharacterized protein n=1 Tax=Rhizophora mucronata TaxID=61149 RepID=A0A2P2Q9H4_RHIMU